MSKGEKIKLGLLCAGFVLASGGAAVSFFKMVEIIYTAALK